MFKWLTQFRNASKETRRFIYTVIALFIIVLGTFFFAFLRLQFPTQRSLSPQTEQAR